MYIRVFYIVKILSQIYLRYYIFYFIFALYKSFIYIFISINKPMFKKMVTII